MTRKDTIYRSSQPDRIVCAVFRGDECIYNAYLRKGETSPVYLDTLGIHLMSGYDVEQTLIPGLTKRVIEYCDHDITYAEIQWNNDETYSIRFPDEVVNIVRIDKDVFAFQEAGETIATISRYGKDRESLEKDYRYEPIYQVESVEGISSMCLSVVFGWPLLYFGF